MERGANNPKLQAAQARVQEMYDIFKKEVDIDTVMTRSEFTKYEPLYSKSTMPEGRSMTVAEVASLAELSQEFYRRVNPQRPIHIVDDYSGEEAFTLPPIYTKLRPLSGDQAGIMDIYSNVHDSKLQQAGPLVAAKQDQVDYMLKDNYTRSQNRDEILGSMRQFEQLATEFHKKVMGDNPFATNPEGSKVTRDGALATAVPPAKEANDEGPDADFDF